MNSCTDCLDMDENDFGKVVKRQIKHTNSVIKLSLGHDLALWEKVLNPFQNVKILDWSKLKQIANGILKCI